MERPDGAVLVNMRNNHQNTTCDCRAVAISTDGGASFGEVLRPLPPLSPPATCHGHTFSPPPLAQVFYDPELPSPVCMASILRGRGDALYFANPGSVSERAHGLVKRSDDGGRSWPRALQVSAISQPYAYSCLSLVPDPNKIGLLWETGRENCGGPSCQIVFSDFDADF